MRHFSNNQYLIFLYFKVQLLKNSTPIHCKICLGLIFLNNFVSLILILGESLKFYHDFKNKFSNILKKIIRSGHWPCYLWSQGPGSVSGLISGQMCLCYLFSYFKYRTTSFYYLCHPRWGLGRYLSEPFCMLFVLASLFLCINSNGDWR